VADVMTREVATVAPATPVKEIARVLAQRRVSALPVVDLEGRVVGVVSEADLLLKEGRGALADPPRRFEAASRRAQRAKAGATGGRTWSCWPAAPSSSTASSGWSTTWSTPGMTGTPESRPPCRQSWRRRSGGDEGHASPPVHAHPQARRRVRRGAAAGGRRGRGRGAPGRLHDRARRRAQARAAVRGRTG